MPAQRSNDTFVGSRADLLHRDEGGEAEARRAEKAVGEGLSDFALQIGGVHVGEGERARHRPLARRRGTLEDALVARIEPNCLGKSKAHSDQPGARTASASGTTGRLPSGRFT